MFPCLRVYAFVCVLQSLCVRIFLHDCQLYWLYSSVLQYNNPLDTISDMILISYSTQHSLTCFLLLKAQHI